MRNCLMWLTSVENLLERAEAGVYEMSEELESHA